MDTATTSHSRAARSIRERWPSCSAPMVGTTPTVRPDSRMASSAREYSSTVSNTATRGAIARWAVQPPWPCALVSTGLTPPALPLLHVLRLSAPRRWHPRSVADRTDLEREPAGQPDHGVVRGQFGAVPGHRPQRGPVTLHRVPVPPGRGTGQGRGVAPGRRASSVAARIRPANASRGNPAVAATRSTCPMSATMWLAAIDAAAW